MVKDYNKDKYKLVRSIGIHKSVEIGRKRDIKLQDVIEVKSFKLRDARGNEHYIGNASITKFDFITFFLEILFIVELELALELMMLEFEMERRHIKIEYLHITRHDGSTQTIRDRHISYKEILEIHKKNI